MCQWRLFIIACIIPRLPALGLISQESAANSLAFIHVPYNFGHTVETAAFFPLEYTHKQTWEYIGSLGGIGNIKRRATWKEVKRLIKPGGEAWGHLNPELQEISSLTGCPLYFTPPKYWPEDIAKKYIGNRTTFGILRDPAERLVAMFRGNFKDYGGSLKEYYETCDVDTAVKSMVRDYMDSEDPWGKGCCRIPQAEYFDGANGIQLFVDNRAIPHNINAILKWYGYNTDDWHIPIEKVWHVSGCNEVGTWNLTAETKALIRQAFSRDYELLCNAFGYCTKDENTCLVHVPEMCPSWVDKWEIPINGTPFRRFEPEMFGKIPKATVGKWPKISERFGLR